MAAPKGNKFAVGNKGGAPPKYTPEVIAQLAEEMLAWFQKPKNWWLKDFAISKGMHWQRFSEFAKVSDVFSDALLLCKDMQESKLVKKGFQPYKDRMAMNALKNVAGWRDQQTFALDEHQFEVIIGKAKDTDKNS